MEGGEGEGGGEGEEEDGREEREDKENDVEVPEEGGEMWGDGEGVVRSGGVGGFVEGECGRDQMVKCVGEEGREFEYVVNKEERH